MHLSNLLLQSDVKELENELQIIQNFQAEKSETLQFEGEKDDKELTEFLSASHASIVEQENGHKQIRYAREFSSNGGKRKAELTGEFTQREGTLSGSLRIRGRDMTDGSLFFDWKKFVSKINLAQGTKEEVSAAIKHSEAELHKEMTLYNNAVSEKCTKHLRRQLPVTKTKIDWERFAMQPRIPKKGSL